jgi:lipid-binding SYLF domain-containing protein
MFRSKQTVALVALLVFAFSSAVIAQDSGCRQKPTAKMQAPQCCMQQQGVKQAPQCCVQQQGVKQAPQCCMQQQGVKEAPQCCMQQQGAKEAPQCCMQQQGVKQAPQCCVQQQAQQAPQCCVQQQAQQAPQCCVQQQAQQAPQCCVQRQKPCAVSKPAGCIAPRVLPAVDEREAARAAAAADVVSNMPFPSMIENANAVAVIPAVRKGAFIFGGRWGKGLMTMRDEDGCWLPPSFIEITGGNFGFQAGYEATDLVLIFTSRDAIRALLRGKLTLNAYASGAAGPWGRNLQGGFPILFNSGIYAYSRSHGLFVGAAVDGAVVTIDDTANQRVYGKYINGDDILLDHRVESNAAVAPFLNAMGTYSPSGRNVQAQAAMTED